MAFKLFTDHKNLKYILMQKGLNRQQRRWLEFLANYDIDITYYPEMTNVVADALSKRLVVCGARLSAMSIRYEDQREDVADRQLVVVLSRLTISSTIKDLIR